MKFLLIILMIIIAWIAVVGGALTTMLMWNWPLIGMGWWTGWDAPTWWQAALIEGLVTSAARNLIKGVFT